VNGTAYTLRGSLAPVWMLGRDPGVIVTVEATSARATSDADLRERFGLTTREVDVARLVASGLSNQALAEKLGVSFFTARNHVERLMVAATSSSTAEPAARRPPHLATVRIRERGLMASCPVTELRERDPVLLGRSVVGDAIGVRVVARRTGLARTRDGQHLVTHRRIGGRLLREDVRPRDHRLLEDERASP
jgi:DNA-binding CsgD family transcriptional regulator